MARTLLISIMLIGCCLSLCACGQAGKLYLPSKQDITTAANPVNEVQYDKTTSI